MLRFSIAQMRASIGRLVAAGIAIVLGTGFVTAALLASDVLRATAEATIVGELNGADVVAQVQPFTDDDIRAIEALPGVAGVDPQWVQGMPLTANHTSQYAEIQSLPQYGQAPPLGDGALPSGDGQIMVSEQFAEALGVGIGDQLRWSDFMSELEGTLTITAISGEGALLLTDAPVWSTLNTVRMLQELRDFQPISPAELLIFGDGTRTQDELVAAIEAVDDGLGLTSAQAIIDIRVEDMAGNSQFFVYFGLAFAAVAVIVAGMVITNTFEVLVAQRTKVLALMRCGGATKGQVLRSVLNEALLLGLLASVGGVLLGLALGQGAVWFLGTRLAGVAVPTLTDIDPATLVAPIIVGVVMTLVAAFGPARASTHVPPVAALRPQAVDPVRGGGRWRLAIGILMMAVGLALLVGPPLALRLSVESDVSTLADYVGLLLAVGIAGGLLTVAGYLVLSVFIVPRIVRLLGAIVALPLPKEAAATARLATANAVRNPRRTAATTSALVIGVGLVVMMATGAATARATLSSTLDSSFPADVAVSATAGSGLTDEEIAAVEQVPGVIASAVVRLSGANIQQADGSSELLDMLLVADPVELETAVNSRPFEVPDGHLAVDDRAFERLGSPAEVDLALDGDVQTVPVARVRDLPVTFLIAPADLELGDPPPAMMILADVDDDRADEVVGDLRQAMSDLSGEMAPYVEAPIEMRAMFDQIIDALLAVLIGLLAVAVVIALVGVANTLSLSVIERRREHGVLRAIGVTSPQVRQMLAVEAVLIAVAGAVIGILLGVLTGLAGSAILLGGTLDFTVGIDWWVMLGCAVIALVAGLVASVLPARTATRVPVVVALAAD